MFKIIFSIALVVISKELCKHMLVDIPPPSKKKAFTWMLNIRDESGYHDIAPSHPHPHPQKQKDKETEKRQKPPKSGSLSKNRSSKTYKAPQDRSKNKERGHVPNQDSHVRVRERGGKSVSRKSMPQLSRFYRLVRLRLSILVYPDRVICAAVKKKTVRLRCDNQA